MSRSVRDRRLDPASLSVLGHRLASVAEEMGVVLGRTAFSPNVKERRDSSCAVFDAAGALVAQAAHIPVHLASTAMSVRAVLDRLELGPGDVAIVNDPFAGGTHLPDVTLVTPVFLPGEARPFAWVANRAHHADIGGQSPGSMALATEIVQEGFRIPPVRLVVGGRLNADVLTLFLANTRVREEREGDLRAQIAALEVGRERLIELAARLGARDVRQGMAELQDYAARLMTAAIEAIPDGTYRARDVLDDDGFGHDPVEIAVELRVKGGRLTVDFAGTSPQVRGPMNANEAITSSATFYVLKALAPEAIPANEGLLRPVEIRTPPGSIVAAREPAAVAGGNVETSQRIVDVLLRAFALALPDRVPAASAGSMSNLAIGGWDPVRQRAFSYYETIAGGAGGGPLRAGASAIQTHMTNTRNTPIEVLEATYPLRVTELRIRTRSGGRGRHAGGEGLIREIEALAEVEVSLLADRRTTAPWGTAGGLDARPGVDRIFRGGRWRKIRGKATLTLRPGERIRVETPGGGGWGPPPSRG